MIAKKAKKVGKVLGYLDDKLIGGRGSKLIDDAYQFGSKKLSKSEGKGHGDPTEKSIRRKKEKKYLEKEKEEAKREEERKTMVR